MPTTDYDLSPYLQGSYLPSGTSPIDISSLLEGHKKLGDDGLWYWGGDKKNPVPLPDVPGAPINPSSVYQDIARQTQAVRDLMPYLNDAVLQTLMPSALAQLDVERATSGPRAQLMLDLFNQYGPQLNAVGSEITRRNALSQAETDRQVLAGPGKGLVEQALETAKIYDPEYFALREQGAGAISDLLNNVNLNEGLSSVERDEIAKGLVREGQQRGTPNAPSNTEIVGNAMQYGQAGRNRLIENEGRLSKALQTASQFMPFTKSGVDVFQVATGKPSTPNQGANQFTGINTPNSQNQFGLAGNMFGQAGQMASANKQIAAQEKDWLDNFVQFTEGLSNIGNTIGSFAGGAIACWVAREVYGITNPKWIMFRRWLLTQSPDWFRGLYMAYGPKFAEFIHNKPMIKTIVRDFMDYILETEYVKKSTLNQESCRSKNIIQGWISNRLLRIGRHCARRIAGNLSIFKQTLFGSNASKKSIA